MLIGTETQRIQRKPTAEKKPCARPCKKNKASKKRPPVKVMRYPTAQAKCSICRMNRHGLLFVQSGVPALREANWQISITDGFHFNLQPVEEWYADIEESPGREWFDLQLGIVVNGERHSLLPILLHLLRNQPQLMNPAELVRRDDNDQVLIDLNSGQFGAKPGTKVALPLGRVKPLMATLGELYLRVSNGNSLRLNTPDAARLSELEGLPLVWQGGERLRSFAKRLRESTHAHVAAPEDLNAVLRPYQLEGLNWMQTLRELEVGGILGDDMGLGKNAANPDSFTAGETGGASRSSSACRDAYQPHPQLAR